METLRIQPQPGLVMALMTHESRSVSRPSGLLVPGTSQLGCDWYGVVFGVGRGVSTLAFGDVIYISRWAGKQWDFRPAGKGFTSEDYRYHLVNARDEGQIIEACGTDYWVTFEPLDAVYKVTDWRGNLGLEGGLEHGTHPVSRRVLLRVAPRAALSSGLIDPGVSRWINPQGTVVSVAPDVTDILPGQQCWFDADARLTRWVQPDGAEMAMVVYRDILAVR